MATIHDIDITRGDTFIGFKFQCLVNGTPFDLTDASIKCEIREHSKDGRLILRRELGSGLTVLDAATGMAQFDKLKFKYNSGTFYYDIQVTDSVSDVRTFVTGKITVNQDVTK